MRVLLTRPLEQAKGMALELEDLGHAVIVSPLLERQFLEIPANLGRVGALVFTSLNGVAAIAGRIPHALLSLPVFAIGERTAAAAREAGFTNLIVGQGRASDLVPVITGFEGQMKGRIVHISGQVLRTDVAALLNAEGRPAERLIVYRMVAQESFSDEAVSAMRRGELDVVLFFSPRSAELFATLIRAQGLAASLERVVAVALSEAVAEPLHQLGWAEIRIAGQADRKAMYERLSNLER